MLELPETITIGTQIKKTLSGKTVLRVLPPTKPHKFTWFGGDPADFDSRMRGSRVVAGNGFGSNAEFVLDNGLFLNFSDGASPRLYESVAATPKDYQLLIEFSDGAALAVSVAMYGGIVLHDSAYDNPYYTASRSAVSPLSGDFAAHFERIFSESKPTLSAKAFLATEQRFPGLGNGALQDILLNAGIHPKRKIGTLSEAERARLLDAVISTLQEMTARGGRDTEKDLFGKPGGYRTKLSKNTLATGCPHCGGPIVKEAYMGGAVYFCPACQPLN
ncbi:MAG: endonuclease VIII [Clostridiales bacterium]|nr:endonuclease VIII [Clostridiales bacterium]